MTPGRMSRAGLPPQVIELEGLFLEKWARFIGCHGPDSREICAACLVRSPKMWLESGSNRRGVTGRPDGRGGRGL